MKHHFVAVILLFFCAMMMSCAFEQDNFRIISNIEGNYYLTDDPTNPNDGLKIVYTKDKQFYQTLSSNCFDIYFGVGSILFSTKAFSKSIEVEHYYIKTDSASSDYNTPILITDVSFFKQIKRLKELKISPYSK